MTPDRFRACLASLQWSQRGLADLLEVNERQVRRWAEGAIIPAPVAAWLVELADFHDSHPPPFRQAHGLRRKSCATP